MKTPTVVFLGALLMFAIFSAGSVSKYSAKSRLFTPTADEGEIKKLADQTSLPVSSTHSRSYFPAREKVRIPTKSAPQAVQSFFPSITQRVDNWRTFNPETLTVSPFPEMPVTFTRVSCKKDSSLTGGHYTTWVGRSSDMPGASLVTVGTDSGYDAILVVPGNGEMSFHISGTGEAPGDVTMSAVNSVEAGCGIDSVPSRPSLAPHTAALYAANYLNVMGNAQMPAAAIVVADGVPTVDLLYIYDSTMLDLVKTLASGDAVSLLDGKFKAVTETVNVFLAQSGIATFKFKYLGVLAAPAYTRTGHLPDDLTAMLDGGAIGTWLAKTRYDYGADEVCLLVGTSQDYSGVATMSPQLPPRNSSAASCVVAGNGGWGPTANFVSAETVAHEIGHTLGCNHDRVTANIFKDGKYCYGWQTTATVTTGSYSFTGTLGTIMSYANGRIPYYSNPNLTVDIYFELYNPLETGSTPIGTPPNLDFGSFIIGAPATDDNPQSNATVMADNGPLAANLMDSIGLPVIIQQPAAATAMTTGQEVKLTVVAQGGGLYYQWSKDGALVVGATSAVLTKSALITTDAGNYSVSINNTLGAVTSNMSSVTISVAPTPVVTPPSTPSSGGSGSSGGGGGGSIQGWFALMLFALVATRAISRIGR